MSFFESSGSLASVWSFCSTVNLCWEDEPLMSKWNEYLLCRVQYLKGYIDSLFLDKGDEEYKCPVAKDERLSNDVCNCLCCWTCAAKKREKVANEW